MSAPNWSMTCAVCLDPCAPDAAVVEEKMPSGETRTVHAECAEPKAPPAPKRRLVGADRGKEREG